jgi:hypothetical protein
MIRINPKNPKKPQPNPEMGSARREARILSVIARAQNSVPPGRVSHVLPIIIRSVTNWRAASCTQNQFRVQPASFWAMAIAPLR